MRRSIILEDLDGKVIEKLALSEITSVKTHTQMFYLDKLSDGTWRLLYSEGLVPDITKLHCLKIVKEDDHNHRYNIKYDDKIKGAGSILVGSVNTC